MDLFTSSKELTEMEVQGNYLLIVMTEIVLSVGFGLVFLCYTTVTCCFSVIFSLFLSVDTHFLA